MNVAMLLSCSSFEGFFGKTLKQDRESYLAKYRNDWSWYYARGLLDNGITPILYVPALYETGKYETDVGVAVRFLALEHWYRPLERVWLKQLARQTRWTAYAEERITAIALMRSLQEALVADKVDLLYVQEYWTGRFDHVVHRVDVPVVGADHGGVGDAVLKLFKASALKKAAVCYGQTENECRVIEKYSGHPMFQPNGCDVAEFSPDPNVQRGKTILTVTRLTNKQKRTSDLIRALGELPEEWSLDIVGTGPDRGMLEKLSVDLGLASRVRFHGFVSRAEVPGFLRRCGVYAMPSDNEGLAVAALEAMACGAAVVFTRIRGFETIVTDGVNGRLVPVGDVKSLAAAIVDAWERRDELGRAATATVRAHYDKRVLYSQLADSLRGCVRQAVGRSGSQPIPPALGQKAGTLHP
jgi:glycosyltransferase involved in cell wall biosynthesis